MSNVRIEVHYDAVGGLLKGPEISALIASKCAAIADAATNASDPGALFGHGVETGSHRAQGKVWTANALAMVAEAEDRVLTRSLDAGRG